MIDIKSEVEQTLSERVLNEKECRRIVSSLMDQFPNDGSVSIRIASWWGAGQRWARNSPSMTSDQRQFTIRVGRTKAGAAANVSSNQYDIESLRGMATNSEFNANRWADNVPEDREVFAIEWNPTGANVWSDTTFNRSVEANASAVSTLVKNAVSNKLLSAGYLETTGSTALVYTKNVYGKESFEWGQVTQASCSMTVRHPTGLGSGWAGKTSFDLGTINIADVAAISLDKCIKSLNAVRIEPGRYQTILEPDAVATMTSLLIQLLQREPPEGGSAGATYLGPDNGLMRHISKLGLKVFDERISLSHDPTDAIVGTHPDNMVSKVKIIDRGILTNLYTTRLNRGTYFNEHADLNVALMRSSFVVDGGNIGIDEMISNTKRGLLVARLAQPELVDGGSGLFTGVTRDGLWLIENGKISKAVRNFRWTESPFFIFNNLEEIGSQEKVFSPVTSLSTLLGSFSDSLKNVVVPYMKVNDFSFTSTIDAV